MLLSFLQVSVTCKAERSDPRQSRYTDSDFGIGFLMKKCFVVVNDENLSCETVQHQLGDFRILRYNHPCIQDIHPHQSKYSLKASSLLCCAELLYSMQGDA